MTTPTTTPGIPTQVAHPWRSVLRVFVAALVALVVRWLADRGLDLTALSDAMVDSITNVLTGLALGVAQWLLTRPGVEAWLRRYVPLLATGVHKEAPRTPDGAHVITDAPEVDATPPPAGYQPRHVAED